LTRSLTRKDTVNLDSYENFCPEDRPEVDQKSELNKIKELNKRNSGYNNQVEELFNYYHEKTNAYKHNSNQAKKNIKKLLKK